MIKQKSFTLIELLVVIVIIGILAGVIIISTSSSIDKANIAKSKVFEESIENNLAANMVSRWKLDEGTGTVINDIWGNKTATLTNAAWRNENECVSGKCLNFDGLGDYVLVGNVTTSSVYTVSLWATFDNSSWKGSVIGFGTETANTNDLYFLGDSSQGFGLNTWQSDCYGTSAAFIKDGKFHYITAILFNSSYTSFKLFIDGVEKNISQVQGTTTNKLLVNNFCVGCNGWTTSDQTHKGRIDDVRIYNAALSSAEIKQNYIAGLNSMLANGNISTQEYNERINVLAYDN